MEAIKCKQIWIKNVVEGCWGKNPAGSVFWPKYTSCTKYNILVKIRNVWQAAQSILLKSWIAFPYASGSSWKNPSL